MEVNNSEAAKKKKILINGCLIPTIIVIVIIFLIPLSSSEDKGYSDNDINSLSDSLHINKDSAESILVYNLKRKQTIESSFSALYGYHNGLKNTVKNSLKDPDSFEHVLTKYWDNGDHLIVLMKYRAKNSFGGFVVNVVKAKISLDGKEIIIISQD